MPALKPFLYERPVSTEQLSALLAQHDGVVPRYLAGGTDLLVAVRTGKDNPELLVDLKGLPDLRGINWCNEGKLWIGALTTIHSLEVNDTIRSQAFLLFEAAQSLGSWQVRNRGTIGGNLTNASPAADSAPALIALDAKIELVNATRTREVPLEKFFTGPGKTIIGPDEILKRIVIPDPKPKQFSVYLKFGPRQAMDIAVVGVAIALIFNGDRECKEARVVLGAVGATPFRAVRAEAALQGRIDEAVVEHAATEAMADAKPIDDVRASAEYRKHLVGVLVRRGLNPISPLTRKLRYDKPEIRRR